MGVVGRFSLAVPADRDTDNGRLDVELASAHFPVEVAA